MATNHKGNHRGNHKGFGFLFWGWGKKLVDVTAKPLFLETLEEIPAPHTSVVATQPRFLMQLIMIPQRNNLMILGKGFLSDHLKIREFLTSLKQPMTLSH